MLKGSRRIRTLRGYKYIPPKSFTDKYAGLLLMAGTIAGCLYFQSKNIRVFLPRADVELISPIVELTHGVSKVQASEVESAPSTPSPTPSPEPKTQKEEIEAYIREVFGSKAKEALIVSHCESKYIVDVEGDTNLMVLDPVYQEMIGDSIGVFQIRTGGYEKSTGRYWNRARKEGVTADEFRVYLKDYRNNVRYAKKMYDAEGWTPWTCKKDLYKTK